MNKFRKLGFIDYNGALKINQLSLELRHFSREFNQNTRSL